MKIMTINAIFSSTDDETIESSAIIKANKEIASTEDMTEEDVTNKNATKDNNEEVTDKMDITIKCHFFDTKLTDKIQQSKSRS